MAGRKTKLTGAVLETIAARVRAGAFAWAAAEAAGISERTFYNWLTRGERGEQPFDRFEAAIRQARAQARVDAEIRVHRHSPLAWLRYGPGRSRRGQPGWTEPANELDPEELGQEDPAEMDELSRALAEARWDDPAFVVPIEPAPEPARAAEPGHVCCGCVPRQAEAPPAAPEPALISATEPSPERVPPAPEPARVANGGRNTWADPRRDPYAGAHLSGPGTPSPTAPGPRPSRGSSSSRTRTPGDRPSRPLCGARA